MIATTRLYWNATKTKLVPEGKEAAFLAYPVGSNVPEDVAAKHGLVAKPKPAEPSGDAIDNLEDREQSPLSRKRFRK